MYPVFIVFYCSRKINHLVSEPFAFILWCKKPCREQIPCLSYSWFWQMTILWHYPLNFFASTYRFRRPRSDRGCLFNYFFNPTAHLEATVTFSNFPVMILTIVTFCPPLVKQAQRLPVGPRWPVTKCHISFQSKSWRPVTIQVKKKVDVLLQWQNVLLSGGGGGL
jgi:hypothetical protein